MWTLSTRTAVRRILAPPTPFAHGSPSGSLSRLLASNPAPAPFTAPRRCFLGGATPVSGEPVAFRDTFKMEDEALMAEAEARDKTIR